MGRSLCSWFAPGRQGVEAAVKAGAAEYAEPVRAPPAAVRAPPAAVRMPYVRVPYVRAPTSTAATRARPGPLPPGPGQRGGSCPVYT